MIPDPSKMNLEIYLKIAKRHILNELISEMKNTKYRKVINFTKKNHPEIYSELYKEYLIFISGVVRCARNIEKLGFEEGLDSTTLTQVEFDIIDHFIDKYKEYRDETA